MEEVRKEREKPSLMGTNLLLIVTILIQLYLYMVGPSKALKFYNSYSLMPANLFSGVNIDSVFTYMFLHGNLVHLLVNSVALYGAGRIVERDIGRIRYLLVFILSGVAAGLVHCLLNPSSEIPLVGSSGAIFGVIAVLFLLMPFKITFALFVPLPSVIVGIMLSLVELSAFWMASDFGVAHDAHLAGFVMGGLCAFVIDKKRAVKGLFIAAGVLIVIYYLGVYFNLLPASG